MVAVVSKLLLLVALFSGIENAVEGRSLSFDHFPKSLPQTSSNGLKSGKSSKSGKSAKKSKTVGIGKGSKSPKADKYLHVDGDLTVEYTVVENNESDVDVVEKAIKMSKNEASYEGSDKVKSPKSDDGSDGVKSSKSDTDASANKSSKAGKWCQNLSLAHSFRCSYLIEFLSIIFFRCAQSPSPQSSSH